MPIIRTILGGYELYKDGLAIGLDVPALIECDRTYVPARAVSEAFDCDVDWDEGSKTVLITNNSGV